MSLDTKYRPRRYEDVLGQDATIEICKEIVRKGHGFHHSYVFGGGHGSGKTTLGRILARALLCENPQDGEPCDECHSCKSMLAGESECFIEVDAATNSGKENIRSITEDSKFGSFSGNRKIWLFDESHELSRQAMDAMLKPLEDNIRGSSEKQLVCIFCTTEVNKMRPAILSRCAPVFRIRPNTPEEIASRLSYICEQESIEYDSEILPLICEIKECHIRDAIKAVEGVANLGPVNRENVFRYLQLDANTFYLDILENLGSDHAAVLSAAGKLSERVSPASAYREMADVCMLAMRLSVVGNAPVPSYWDKERLKAIGEKHKGFLVEFAEKFGSRPLHATPSMLLCDLSALHQRRAGIVLKAATTEVLVPSTQPVSTKTNVGQEEISSQPIEPSPSFETNSAESTENSEPTPGNVPVRPHVSPMGVYIHPQAQNARRFNGTEMATTPTGLTPLTEDTFSDILQRRVIELTEEKSISGRPARWDDVGSS